MELAASERIGSGCYRLKIRTNLRQFACVLPPLFSRKAVGIDLPMLDNWTLPQYNLRRGGCELDGFLFDIVGPFKYWGANLMTTRNPGLRFQLLGSTSRLQL